MPLFSRCIFQVISWASRRGLREERDEDLGERKQQARRAGMRGETYAYWYLRRHGDILDRKSTRLNSSHLVISYAVFCLKKKKKNDWSKVIILTTYMDIRSKYRQKSGHIDTCSC